MEPTYSLVHHAYCGMPIPLEEKEDKETCRQAAARRIRSLRLQGFPVVTLDKGRRWEVQEPEGTFLVPDECGILLLAQEPSPYGACPECGDEWDWHSDGRGSVLCGCQACCDCGEVWGHSAGCSSLASWEVSSEVYGRFPIFRREGMSETLARQELAGTIRQHRAAGWVIRRVECSFGDRRLYEIMKDGERHGEIVLIQR